jgi:hypothetical protein
MINKERVLMATNQASLFGVPRFEFPRLTTHNLRARP